MSKMAKLSKGNLAAKKDVQVSKVDDWNPPLVSSATAALMLPPKSRPLPRVPTTPSGNSHTKSTNSKLQDSSSKKKRRRRGGKRNGDSASEVTTTISEDTSAQASTSPSHNRPKVLVPASQSGLSFLPPNASAEEIRVFENEPEIFGVYASSDGEDQEGDEQPITVPPRAKRVLAYSPSITTGFAESSPVRGPRQESIQPPRATSVRPQIGSDVERSSTVQVPAPKKLSDGRFECPVKVEYDCEKTFGDAKSARRHADTHVNANRFKCEKCDKGFSRHDTFARHVKAHDKQTGTSKQAKTARTKQANGARSDGFVDTKRAKKGRTTANVLDGDLEGTESSDGESFVQAEDDELVEDAKVPADKDSVQSESDEEELPNTNDKTENLSSLREDDEDNEFGAELLSEEADAGKIPTSPSERTIFSSPARALSPAKNDQFIAVNGGVKRKCPSPRASPEFKFSPSHKRMRRDLDQDIRTLRNSRQINLVEQIVASPAKSSRATERKVPQNVDIEMSVQDDSNRKEQSDVAEIMESDSEPGSSTDVEMEGNGQGEEPEDESASGSDDQSARSPTPVLEHRKTNSIESAAARTDNDSSDSGSEEREEEEEAESEEENHEGQNEAGDQSDTDAGSKSSQNRTKKPTEIPPTSRRQSSMDNFVQRSESATTSAEASGSRLGVGVNIPVRPATQSKKVQGKLVLQEQIEPQRSTQIRDIPPADDSDGDESIHGNGSQANATKKPRTLNKGKGKAQDQDANGRFVTNEIEEKTSSEDRPRATTIARRTSSLGSKGRPQLRNRTISKKRTKPVTDSDESEESERSKSKPKKPSKKKPKPPVEEEPEQSEKSKRKIRASTAKSTWAEASKTGVTGKFTEDEIQTLNAWRDSFCEENNLTAYEFNEMMMNSASVSKTDWRYGWITKADFMQQYYEQLPERNRRSMIRFRERQFHNADTTPWTGAHDKELRELVAERGTKWVEIAQIMGRTTDAVNQRWRHKLNYGEKPALMGEWTTEEVEKLEDEVMAFAQLKHTTPDDDELQIPWIAISKKMGNGRTAQQCSNRWRINTSRRVNGKFVKVPHNDRLPGTKVKKPRTPSKMEKRLSGQQSTPKSDKMYKSKEKIEDSESDEEDEAQAGDADDESNDTHFDDAPEADDEQTGLENDEKHSQTAAGNEEEQKEQSQQPEDDSASSSEDADMIPNSEQGQSSSKSVVQSPSAITYQALATDTAPTKSSPMKRHMPSQPGSSSQPIPKATQHTSHSASPSQVHSLPSSQPPTFKTPAISRNPLKRASRNRSSPDAGLTLSQLHAGTQANSSAKRTTGRTNRTRVPDSAVTEDRPSPDLSLRRRPVRSSSPLMSLLIDDSRGSGAGDEDEDEDGDNSEDAGSQDLQLDFKSPTSFVSARDTAETSDDSDNDNDSVSDENEDQNEQSNTDNRSNSDTSSSFDSDDNSTSDQPPSTNHQDSGFTFWQSVNQNFRKLTGLSQDGSGRSQSQSQSQDRKGKAKGRMKLADVLRRRSRDAEEESGSGSEDD